MPELATPVLTGLVSMLVVAVLRLLKGRPSREELDAFILALVLSFIDGFMIAYLVPYIPSFISKLSFHVFIYLLLASLTAVIYASYRAISDVKVYAAAMAPWFFILVLIVAAAAQGSRVVFLF
ncbi:hypothetical protein [Infirmifilum uzonense]|jgi:hypothetical protein|uniref:hypothetical protein n=1 Tax=Infirmifilum uzonense TaxID=1550241 RepID=UPI003C783218